VDAAVWAVAGGVKLINDGRSVGCSSFLIHYSAMNRRSFLAATPFAAAGLLSPRRVAAIDPVKRPGPARFKFSLA
jgi:hypothetical protein